MLQQKEKWHRDVVQWYEGALSGISCTKNDDDTIDDKYDNDVYNWAWTKQNLNRKNDNKDGYGGIFRLCYTFIFIKFYFSWNTTSSILHISCLHLTIDEACPHLLSDWLQPIIIGD